jgi:hypothetical protein
MSEDEYDVFKNERFDKLNLDNLESIKNVIEYFNLWYIFECKHCQTIFLVEDSIDKAINGRTKIKRFKAYCPNCKTANLSSKTKRVKLGFKGLAKPMELSAYSNVLIKSRVA